MSFEPRSGAHAILEAVFGLQLARSLTPAEMELAVNAHDRWRDALPKLSRMNVLQLVIGDQPPAPGSVPVGGVLFDSLKRDGTPAWRLRLEHNAFYVNCLEYDTWTAVWKKARTLLSDAMNATGVADEPLMFIYLQYIDAFDWKGPVNEYDVDQLLDPQSRYVPPTVRGRGPLWHLHQGWLRNGDLPVEGRILERAHIDAVEENGGYTVKIDTLLRLDLLPPVAKSMQELDGAFAHLHGLNKDLLRDHITEQMAARIKLDG